MTNLVNINNSEKTQAENSGSSEIIFNTLNTLSREEENLVRALRKQAYQERMVRDLRYAFDSVLTMVQEYKSNELYPDHKAEDNGLSESDLQGLKDHIFQISEYVNGWAEARVETCQDILAEQRTLIARMIGKKA